MTSTRGSGLGLKNQPDGDVPLISLVKTPHPRASPAKTANIKRPEDIVPMCPPRRPSANAEIQHPQQILTPELTAF